MPALVLVIWAGTLEGQSVPPVGSAPPTVSAQAPLGAAAGRFARVWAEGDPGALQAFVASGGARLHLDGTSHGVLSPRQAVAALGSFRSEHRSRGIEVVRVSEVGGAPPRGFAEIAWKGVRAGTVEALSYTVYVGFVWGGEDWLVTEVRVMR